jgi:hypothetical protein
MKPGTYRGEDGPWIIKQGSKTIQTPGVDWGRGPTIVWTQGNRFMIVRYFGCTSWSAVGVQSYTPTEYALVRREGDELKILKRASPGIRWRQLLTKWKWEVGTGDASG